MEEDRYLNTWRKEILLWQAEIKEMIKNVNIVDK